MKNRIAAMMIIATTASAALAGAQTAHAGISWAPARSAWFTGEGIDPDSAAAWSAAVDSTYAQAQAWCGGDAEWTDYDWVGGMSPGMFGNAPRYIYYVAVEYECI